MKLLFLAPNPPSPIRVRSYEFVRHLSARGHALTVAAPHGRREGGDVFRSVEDHIGSGLGHAMGAGPKLRSLAGAGLRGEPFQSAVAWDPRFSRRLQTVQREAADSGDPFEILHVEHLRAARYALALQTRLPVVWDSVDSISLLFEQARMHSRSLKGRLMAWVDLSRTRRYEGFLVNRLPLTVATGEADRRRLMDLAAEDAQRRAAGAGALAAPRTPRIEVVPNGVDLERFPAGHNEREPSTVILSGKMSYHANITAARYLVDSIMPIVWNRRPETRVVLAGAEPSRGVRALASGDARVEVTGFVDDLGALLSRATVAVAPLVYGAGIQNKILEAMATATPVVASRTASQALSARPGEALLVAEDAVEFSSALVSLIESPSRARSIGRAGRRYVEARHTWDEAARRLEAVYAESIALWHDAPDSGSS